MDTVKAVKVLTKLEKEYKKTTYYLNFKTPLQLLVAAVLSAQARDETVNAVTPALFKKFKTVKDFASSNVETLIKYVKKINYAGNKSRNIIKTCKILAKDCKSKVPNTIEDLMKLPGIGRKTAVVIMAGAFKKIEGIAVDTHVIRLSNRIGLTKNKNPQKIEKDLIKIIPKKFWEKTQWIFKMHGRKICTSKPKCKICCVQDLCEKKSLN